MVLARDSECEADDRCEEVVGLSNCEENVRVLCKYEEHNECPGDVISADSLCAEEGLVAAEKAECNDSGLCQTIMADGPCGESLVIHCKESEDMECNVTPECGPDQVRSDASCFRGEESCEMVTMCGETITCRPSILCDAVPYCQQEYEMPSSFVCEPEEADCYGITVCNETIFCKQ